MKLVEFRKTAKNMSDEAKTDAIKQELNRLECRTQMEEEAINLIRQCRFEEANKMLDTMPEFENLD